jgi:hypothetical protein
MGDSCIICPLCGFRECGGNICPTCGIIVSSGLAYRLESKFLKCDKCGFIEEGIDVFCPDCKDGLMKESHPNRNGHTHSWDGLTLICESPGHLSTTTMDSATAREIPYCPYCKEPLSVRPVRALPHAPSSISVPVLEARPELSSDCGIPLPNRG